MNAFDTSYEPGEGLSCVRYLYENGTMQAWSMGQPKKYMHGTCIILAQHTVLGE